jgi:hypothetical protein
LERVSASQGSFVVAHLSPGKRLNLGIDGWYRLMPDD